MTTRPTSQQNLSLVAASTEAAIIRREMEFEGYTSWADGWGCRTDGVFYSLHTSYLAEVTLLEDETSKHWLIAARENHDPSYLTRRSGGYGEPIIPKSHIKHSLATLKPSSHSPISEAKQRAIFDILKGLPEKLRGLLMVGPSGCGKTTYASVLVKDHATLRLDVEQTNKGLEQDHELCIFRLRADEWMEQMYAWKYRDFDDKSVCEPAVTIASLREACHQTGWSPIIWVEEIDKLVPTKKQLSIFNSLVDAAYELEGLIIATGNGTVEALTETFGEATMRRITGEYDDPALFKTLDFNKLACTR